MVEDACIVPHILYWVVKFDCHINVEYSASVSLFQYLFKYFFKGPDEVNWKVSRLDDATSQKAAHSTMSKRSPVDQI